MRSRAARAEAEELYDDALESLYDAVRQQITVEGVGYADSGAGGSGAATARAYLHSIREAKGPTQAPSEVPDTWNVKGRIRFGLRASP